MSSKGLINSKHIKMLGHRASEHLLNSLGSESIPNQKEHIADTPRRYSEYWYECVKGLDADHTMAELASIRKGIQPTDNDELIVCGPIDFYSVCPHHLAPVIGQAWVGYVPLLKCIGLSKMPRLVRLLAAKPVIQEDLCTEIRTTLEGLIYPGCGGFDESISSGSMVVLKAVHHCMLVRGVKVNKDCTVTTSSVSGCFKDKTKGARAEFLSLMEI